jgi:hypothetical protein
MPTVFAVAPVPTNEELFLKLKMVFPILFTIPVPELEATIPLRMVLAPAEVEALVKPAMVLFNKLMGVAVLVI